MPRATGQNATKLILLLPILAAAIIGCEVRDDLAEPDEGQVSILVEPPEITAAWVLLSPQGEEILGSGSSVIDGTASGDYRLLWKPVEGFRSPTPNPTHQSLAKTSTTTFEGTYTKIPGPSGTIILTPSPRDLKPSWRMEGPNGFVDEGRDKGMFRGREPGDYKVTWFDVPGYVTPEVMTQTLTADGSLQFNAVYLARALPTGTVRVEVSPAEVNAPWSLDGADGNSYSGQGSTTLTSIPVGQYTLTWGAPDGWSPPQPNPVTLDLTTDGQITFSGTYVAIVDPTGTVAVATRPAGLHGRWLLTGPDGFAISGIEDQELRGRKTGSYLLRWQDVEGFVTPDPVSGQLSADTMLAMEGSYQIATATLRIETVPADLAAPWALTATGQPTRSGSGATVVEGLSEGVYTLTWNELEGWTSPVENPQTVSLVAQDDVTLTGEYTEVVAPPPPPPPTTGTVVIDASPNSIGASWTLRGPDGFSLNGTGDSTLADRAIGSYTLTWKPVAGWNLPIPAEQTKDLAGDATVTFAGTYVVADPPPTGGPIIESVEGTLANGGSFTIRGASLGDHTLDVSSGVGPNGWIDSNAAGLNLEQLSGAWGWDIGLASGSTPHVTTERSHSGGKSMLTRIDMAANGGWQGVMRYQHPNGFRGIYASYWIYFDPINYASNTQWKHWRVNDDGGVSDNCSNVYQLSYWTNGQPNSYQTGPECLLDCPWPAPRQCMLDVVPEPYYAPLYDDPFQYMHHNRARAESFATNAPTPRQWCRVEIWVEASDMDVANGEFMLAITKPNQPRKLVDRWTGMLTHRSDCCRDSAMPWQWFMFQNYFDDNGGGFRGERADFFIDDIYLQFETEARVEIGNNPDYRKCTQLEVQTPTGWSSDSISVELNRGAFAPGSTAYVFVVRDDGEVSGGWPVTLR